MRLRSSRTVALAATIMLMMMTGTACTRDMTESAESNVTPDRALSQPLPETAFRVSWQKFDGPTVAAGATTIPVKVTFQNASDWPWPNVGPTSADPRYSVSVGYRWLSRDGKTIRGYDDHGRFPLHGALPPGKKETVEVPVKTPREAGEYQLQFDLVQEQVAWFESKGADRFIIPMRVE